MHQIKDQTRQLQLVLYPSQHSAFFITGQVVVIDGGGFEADA
ncbi:hypothetical protein [Acidisoma cladoniae]|jgi:hypothetical protein|nr:hypothetical protein [Acidisoma sp. PAMC 29798]